MHALRWKITTGCAGVQVVCGTMGLPTATVRMRGPDGIARTATGMGTGPVDAAYKAIDALVRVQARRLTHSTSYAHKLPPLSPPWNSRSMLWIISSASSLCVNVSAPFSRSIYA